MRTLTDKLRERLFPTGSKESIVSPGDRVCCMLIEEALGGKIAAIRLIFELIDGPIGGALEAHAMQTAMLQPMAGAAFEHREAGLPKNCYPDPRVPLRRPNDAINALEDE